MPKQINSQQELKFIHLEKIKTSNKEGLLFELLNIAQVLISNYASAKTNKEKVFYKTVYHKAKNFYLGQYANAI